LPISLEPLLVHVPAWTMVLFRIAGIFLIGPMLGSSLVPMRMRVFFALGLSFCVYPMLLAPGSAAASLVGQTVADTQLSQLSLWSLAPMVAMEILIGMVIGFGANLPIVGIQMSGQLIDQQMGLAVAAVFNPELDANAGTVSQFLAMLAITVFVMLGGHRVVVATVVGSFSHVPLGGMSPSGAMMDLILGLMTAMLELAIRVAAPVLCLIFLETLAMGFIARTVPQMNILSIGFVLRIVAGTVLLIAVMSYIGDAMQAAITENLRQLVWFFNPAP
jgi:flagellar biosynthetic protein FliR